MRRFCQRSGSQKTFRAAARQPLTIATLVLLTCVLSPGSTPAQTVWTRRAYGQTEQDQFWKSYIPPSGAYQTFNWTWPNDNNWSQGQVGGLISVGVADAPPPGETLQFNEVLQPSNWSFTNGDPAPVPIYGSNVVVVGDTVTLDITNVNLGSLMVTNASINDLISEISTPLILRP